MVAPARPRKMAKRMSASLDFIAVLLSRGEGIVISPEPAVMAALLMDEAHRDAVLRQRVACDEGQHLSVRVTAFRQFGIGFVPDVPLALIAGSHDLLQRPRHSGMGEL